MLVTKWEMKKNEAVAENGMVAAKHPLAAQAGLQVLQEGGNAIDAAVTTAFAMTILEPYMSSIGGSGILLYHDAAKSQTNVVDYFCAAPLAATPDMYAVERVGVTDKLGFGGVKDNANYYGYRSIAVPGMVAGLARTLKEFGTIPLSRALEPAIRLADEGFEATWFTMLQVGRGMNLIARYPATAAIYLRNGRFLFNAADDKPADRLIQKDLAATLRRIAAEGPDGFYKGEIAGKIVQDFQANGNLIRQADFDNYEVRINPSRSVRYRDEYELCFAPSSGGGTVAEAFNILEGFDLRALRAADPQALHLFIESARVAFADRWQHLADETCVDVPYRWLESKEYAALRRRELSASKAGGRAEPWRGGPMGNGSQEPLGGHTTQISVVDKNRHMVSITQTANMVWGSGVVVPGTGVLFNDGMVLFDPVPGRANSIQAGKRPLSSMAPMLVLKNGKPFMTVGAPGGRMIMGTVLRVLHNVIDFGMGIQDACANLYLDASGDKVTVDENLGTSACQGLRDMGHVLDIRQPSILPHLFASPTGIVVDSANGTLHGGADPYHPGIAIGY
jgi:gamma-glutamyltranspeptidase / glutathione hydrolase